MWKEAIICGIIIILIIIGNVITQNYTKESVSDISNKLEELKTIMQENQDKINTEEIKQKMQKIESDWEERHQKLAYYIEHDELESIETDFTSLKSYIGTNEYSEADSELEEAKFLLKHIEDKYQFNMQNIF